jgi:hypothetical protein
MRFSTIVASAVAGLLLATAAAAQTPPPAASGNAATRSFQQLLDEHWAWWLRNNPLQATSLGVREYDRELGDPSLAGSAREAREAQAFHRPAGSHPRRPALAG